MEPVSNFPLVFPASSATPCRDFHGLIPAAGREFAVAFRLPGRNARKRPRDHERTTSTEGIKDKEDPILMVDDELLGVLQVCEDALKDRLARSLTAESFLTDFTELVESVLVSRPLPPRPTEWSGDFYASAFAEIKALGWHRLQDVDESFSELTLKASDSRARSHFVRIALPRSGFGMHGSRPVTVRMDLPGHTAPTKVATSRLSAAEGGSMGLRDILKTFEKNSLPIERDQLDDLDANTWIVEPDPPRRSHTYRRVALGNNLYLHVDLDPLAPLAPPAYKFLGADRAAIKARETARKNVSSWDLSRTLRANLEALIEMPLPPRPATEHTASQSSTGGAVGVRECGICYSHRLPVDFGMDDGPSRSVDADGAVPDQTRKVFLFLCLNLSFTGVEAVYGYLTNSLSLTSDAAHMMFDSSFIALSLAASVVTTWEADDKFTYGFGRVETLTGFVNCVVLMGAAISIIWESVERILEPQHVHSEKLLVVAVLGLAVNIVGIFAFDHAALHGHSHDGHDHHDHGSHAHAHSHSHASSHGHDHSNGSHGNHGHSHGGKEETNPLMHGMFLHVLADTMGSVGVVVSALLIRWFGWTWADPICSLAIAILIVASVYPLLVRSCNVLLQRVPSSVDGRVSELAPRIMAVPGVVGYSPPHVWEMSSTNFVGTVKVQVGEGADWQAVVDGVGHVLRDDCATVEPLALGSRQKFHNTKHSNIAESKQRVEDGNSSFHCAFLETCIRIVSNLSRLLVPAGVGRTFSRKLFLSLLALDMAATEGSTRMQPLSLSRSPSPPDMLDISYSLLSLALKNPRALSRDPHLNLDEQNSNPQQHFDFSAWPSPFPNSHTQIPFDPISAQQFIFDSIQKEVDAMSEVDGERDELSDEDDGDGHLDAAMNASQNGVVIPNPPSISASTTVHSPAGESNFPLSEDVTSDSWKPTGQIAPIWTTELADAELILHESAPTIATHLVLSPSGLEPLVAPEPPFTLLPPAVAPTSNLISLGNRYPPHTPSFSRRTSGLVEVEEFSETSVAPDDLNDLSSRLLDPLSPEFDHPQSVLRADLTSILDPDVPVHTHWPDQSVLNLAAAAPPLPLFSQLSERGSYLPLAGNFEEDGGLNELSSSRRPLLRAPPLHPAHDPPGALVTKRRAMSPPPLAHMSHRRPKRSMLADFRRDEGALESEDHENEPSDALEDAYEWRGEEYGSLKGHKRGMRDVRLESYTGLHAESELDPSHNLSNVRNRGRKARRTENGREWTVEGDEEHFDSDSITMLQGSMQGGPDKEMVRDMDGWTNGEKTRKTYYVSGSALAPSPAHSSFPNRQRVILKPTLKRSAASSTQEHQSWGSASPPSHSAPPTSQHPSARPRKRSHAPSPLTRSIIATDPPPEEPSEHSAPTLTVEEDSEADYGTGDQTTNEGEVERDGLTVQPSSDAPAPSPSVGQVSPAVRPVSAVPTRLRKALSKERDSSESVARGPTGGVRAAVRIESLAGGDGDDERDSAQADPRGIRKRKRKISSGFLEVFALERDKKLREALVIASGGDPDDQASHSPPTAILTSPSPPVVLVYPRPASSPSPAPTAPVIVPADAHLHHQRTQLLRKIAKKIKSHARRLDELGDSGDVEGEGDKERRKLVGAKARLVRRQKLLKGIAAAEVVGLGDAGVVKG
ncbi:hypothetical protein HDU93_002512 [Gonapodya sp. JEL0774]|nr:hypothetical protein HDU93_002512 [Gonapodya sp. JEL0774]